MNLYYPHRFEKVISRNSLTFKWKLDRLKIWLELLSVLVQNEKSTNLPYFSVSLVWMNSALRCTLPKNPKSLLFKTFSRLSFSYIVKKKWNTCQNLLFQIQHVNTIPLWAWVNKGLVGVWITCYLFERESNKLGWLLHVSGKREVKIR